MAEETNLLVYYNVLNMALRPKNYYNGMLHTEPKSVDVNEIFPTKTFDFTKSLFTYDNCGHEIMIEYYDSIYKFAERDIQQYFTKDNKVIKEKIKDFKTKITGDSKYEYYAVPNLSSAISLNIDSLISIHKIMGKIQPDASSYYIINEIYRDIYTIYSEILATNNSYVLYDIINFSWLFRNYFFEDKKIDVSDKIAINGSISVAVSGAGVGAGSVAGSSSLPSKNYETTLKFLVSMLGYIKYIKNMRVDITKTSVEQMLKKYYVPFLLKPEDFIETPSDAIVKPPVRTDDELKKYFEDYRDIYALFNSNTIKYNNNYLYDLAIIFTDIMIKLYLKDATIATYIKDEFIKPFLNASGTKIDDTGKKYETRASLRGAQVPSYMDVAEILGFKIKDYFVDPEYLWYTELEIIDEEKMSFIPSLDVSYLEIENTKKKIQEFIKLIIDDDANKGSYSKNSTLKPEVFIFLLKELSNKPALLKLMQYIFEKCNYSMNESRRNDYYTIKITSIKLSSYPKLIFTITKSGMKIKSWLNHIKPCADYIVPIDIEDFEEIDLKYLSKYKKILDKSLDINWWNNFLLRNINAVPSIAMTDYLNKTEHYINTYGAIAPLPSFDPKIKQVINENQWYPSVGTEDLTMTGKYCITLDSWYTAIINSLSGITVKDSGYINMFADETLTRQDIIHNLRNEMADELSKTSTWPNGLSFVETLFEEIITEMREKSEGISDFFDFIIKHGKYIFSENITPNNITVIDFLYSKIHTKLRLNYPLTLCSQFIVDAFVALSNSKLLFEQNLLERCMVELYIAYIRKGGRAYNKIESQLFTNRYGVNIIGYSYLQNTNGDIKQTHLFKPATKTNHSDNPVILALLNEDVSLGHFSEVISKSYQTMFNNTCIDERKKIDKKYDFDSIPENIYLLQGIISALTVDSYTYSIYSEFIKVSGIKPYVLEVIKNIGNVSVSVETETDKIKEETILDVLRKKDRFKSMKKILKLLKIYYILFEENAQSLVECYHCIINRLIACYADYSAETMTKVKKILCMMSIDDTINNAIPLDFFEAGYKSIYELLADNFAIDKQNADVADKALFDEIVLLPIPQESEIGYAQYSKTGAFIKSSLEPTFSCFDKFIEIIDTPYEKDEVDGNYRAIIEDYCRINYEEIKNSGFLTGNNCKEMIVQMATEEVLKTLLPPISGAGENEMDLTWLGIPELTAASYYLCYAVLRHNHIYFSGDNETVKTSFIGLHKFIIIECENSDSDDFIKQVSAKYMNSIRALIN